MNTRKRPFIIFIFIFSITFISIKGYAKVDTLDNIVVADLTDNWLYYDQEFKTYFPYLKDSKERINSVSQLVDLNKYRLYDLNFTAHPGLSLFIDQKLYYKNNSESTLPVVIKIQDLIKSPNQELKLLSFYQPKGMIPLNTFYIGHTSIYTSTNDNISKASLSIPRSHSSRQNILLITFLFILSLMAIVRNRYPKKFQELSHFSNIIPSVDEDVVWDITSIPVLLFVLINSLCSALILFVINEQLNLHTLEFLNIFSKKLVVGILLVSAGFFLIFLIKYLYLKILGWIFNLSDLVKIQFFELMKVTLKINLILTVLAMIFICSTYFHLKLNFDYFFYFTVISLFIVLLRVAFLSFKLSGFRNIYLFSYLCTTEILPLVIIVKMILF